MDLIGKILTTSLLSAILCENVRTIITDVDTIQRSIKGNASDDDIAYLTNADYGVLNIYKLAFLAKEWAYKKGFDIESSRFKDCQVYLVSSSAIDEALFTTSPDEPFKECIDIFKAASWIKDYLENYEAPSLSHVDENWNIDAGNSFEVLK